MKKGTHWAVGEHQTPPGGVVHPPCRAVSAVGTFLPQQQLPQLADDVVFMNEARLERQHNVARLFQAAFARIGVQFALHDKVRVKLPESWLNTKTHFDHSAIYYRQPLPGMLRLRSHVCLEIATHPGVQDHAQCGML